MNLGFDNIDAIFCKALELYINKYCIENIEVVLQLSFSIGKSFFRLAFL